MHAATTWTHSARWVACDLSAWFACGGKKVERDENEAGEADRLQVTRYDFLGSEITRASRMRVEMSYLGLLPHTVPTSQLSSVMFRLICT